MSDISKHSRDDLDFLPSDCELPAPPGTSRHGVAQTEAPAVAERGAHICLSLYEGRCWCQPRAYEDVALRLSVERGKVVSLAAEKARLGRYWKETR